MRLVGWALHDEEISFDSLATNDGSASGSDYSQTDGRPGLPVPGDDVATYLPHIHHAQDTDLDVIALVPGLPRIDTGAGLGYRENGEEAVSIRGWCEPNLVLGYRPVEWTATATWTPMAAVTCPRSQKVVVCAGDIATTVNASVWVWTPSTRTWSARIEPDPDNIRDMVALCVLASSGRILNFQASSAATALAVHFSDDDGATWDEYAPNAMHSGTLDATVDHLTAVEDRNGAILLLAGGTGSAYWQYVSVDGGATFELVETGTLAGRLNVSRLANGQILVTGMNATSDAIALVIDDATDPISDATVVLLDSTNNISAICSAVDADGIAYALISVQSTDVVKAARTVDNGATWQLYTTEVLQLGGTVADPDDHDHLVRACAFSGGELVGLFNSTHAGAPTTDGSIVSLMLGGWSNLEHTDGTGNRTDRTGWADVSDADSYGIWLPTETLANQGWTGSGTAEALVAGYHAFVGTAGTSSAQLTAGGHSGSAFSLLVEVRVVSGGSLTANDCSVLHQRRDGADATSVVLRCSTTGIRVVDGSGGETVLGTITTDVTTDIVQVMLVYISDLTVSVFWRTRGDTAWRLGPQAETLGTDATAVSTDIYAVGCRSNTTSEMRVGIFAFKNASLANGLTIDTPFFYNRLRYGKALPPVPYPIRDQVDSDGMMAHISGSGGVARYQETWSCPAEWDHGIREIDPVASPTPAARWRSTDTTEQSITWDLDIDSRLGSSWAACLGLMRANFRTAVLEVSTNAAPNTFVELGTYDAIVAESVSFTRAGNLLTPTAATLPGRRFFGAGGLRSGHVIFDPGGTPVARRIEWNSGGGWVGSGVQTVIKIDGIDGTEPTSGTMHIVASSGVLVVHQGAPTAYRRVRLRIPAQDTPNGFFELGNAVVGSLFAIGRQFSRGFSTRYIPIVRDEEDAHGVAFVEARGTGFDGSLLRETTVSWQEGYDLTDIRNGGPAAIGPGGLVADRDVWHQVSGLLRASNGGAVPSILLHEVPPVTSTVTDPTMFSYGRLRGTFQVNHVQGRPGRSEVVRAESLTHVELPG